MNNKPKALPHASKSSKNITNKGPKNIRSEFSIKVPKKDFDRLLKDMMKAKI